MSRVNPAPGVVAAHDTRTFDVLVVGTMNLCRSAVAERLLRAGLEDEDRIVVTSAGTRPALEQPVPEPIAQLLTDAEAPLDGHAPRELDAEAIHQADLVLTTSRETRAEVVRQVPGALRRTFTLLELDRVARTIDPATLPEGDVAERLAALVRAAGPLRGDTAPRDAADDDVLDPYGRDRRAYALSFEQVQAAVNGILRTVRPVPDTEAPPPPPPPRPPVRRRSRALDVALIVLAALVVLVVAVAVGAVVALDRLDDRVERFPDPFAALPTRPAPATTPETAGPSPRQPLTILVLGSADDAAAAAAPEGWAEAASMTDVVMLAHVSADRTSAHVVALPPDMWVDVPGGGQGTLRSAFADGGPPGAVQAVEQLTDVRIDHVALIDAETFARVTQSLGGVDVDVPRAITAGGRTLVPAGPQRLSGERALVWMQAAGPDDAARAQRAQTWLGAILNRLDDDDVRGDPGSWTELLGVVSGSVAVDEGFDRATMVGLLTSMRNLRPGDVGVVTAPTTTASVGDGERGLVADAQPFDALMDAMRTDTLTAHLAAREG